MTMPFVTGAQSHPHHWIDVFAEWQFNPKGQINGVKLRWLFDDYYSVLLADDAKETGDSLQTMLKKVMSNTAKHHYFIQIEQQGTKVEFEKARQARIGVKDNRIEIEFRLSLTKPLNPRLNDIVYRVAEPTYYFEVLHAEKGPAIVLKNAPSDCRYQLEPPKPAAAMVAYAASLGINESGGNDLGINFAEKVTIRCE